MEGGREGRGIYSRIKRLGRKRKRKKVLWGVLENASSDGGTGNGGKKGEEVWTLEKGREILRNSGGLFHMGVQGSGNSPRKAHQRSGVSIFSFYKETHS